MNIYSFKAIKWEHDSRDVWKYKGPPYYSIETSISSLLPSEVLNRIIRLKKFYPFPSVFSGNLVIMQEVERKVLGDD